MLAVDCGIDCIFIRSTSMVIITVLLATMVNYFFSVYIDDLQRVLDTKPFFRGFRSDVDVE
jgi:hypothetical protein